MKLFISQPMRGKRAEEIIKEREQIIDRCKEMYGDDLEVIESYFEQEPESKNPPLYGLGKNLILLADADIAYFAKGWENARGCKVENTCAIEYGIQVIEDYRK